MYDRLQKQMSRKYYSSFFPPSHCNLVLNESPGWLYFYMASIFVDISVHLSTVDTLANIVCVYL